MVGNFIKRISLLLFFVIGFSASFAAAQTQDKTFKNWTVYTTELQGKKTCYIGSSPISKTGNYNNRSEPYFLVMRVNAKTVEVSTSSGYPYKSNSDVKVTIDDSNKYNMYTKGELAWAKTRKDDNDIAQNMKKGNTMSVRGTSTKGTYSLDKYSLSGFTAAYNRMFTLCQ